MPQTIGQTIYAHLDTLTEGLEAFLHQGRDVLWISPTYMPFRIVCLTKRRLLFGFYSELDGTRVPDPGFGLDVQERTVDLDTLVTDTPLGHTRGPEGATYCAGFLQEMVARKHAGIFTVSA